MARCQSPGERSVSGVNHKLVPLMAKHGFNVAGGSFAFKVDENTDPATKVDIDTKVAMQVPVGDDYWYETYGIPKPDNYEELKAQGNVKAHGRASQHTDTKSVLKRLSGFFQKAPGKRGGKTLGF